MMFLQILVHGAAERRRLLLASRQSAYGCLSQVKAVKCIDHSHIERRGCGSLLAIAMHVKVLVIWAAVDQSMDQLRVTMKSKNHRSII